MDGIAENHENSVLGGVKPDLVSVEIAVRKGFDAVQQSYQATLIDRNDQGNQFSALDTELCVDRKKTSDGRVLISST